MSLKPCPFCGQTAAPKLWDSLERAEEYGEDMDRAASNETHHAVVCDASRNGSDLRDGCGATGGFKPTLELAAEAWNRRSL